jgi:hypothetical protein
MAGSIFNRISGKPADSFDRVTDMVTRKLPVPGFGEGDKFIQVRAGRTKEGLWEINVKHNLKSVTAGLQAASDAFQSACKKHAGTTIVKNQRQNLNFDTAFLILRDMEEALLKNAGISGGNEPDLHYMAAYRLLPREFQEGLDEVAHARTQARGEILVEINKPTPASKPAEPKKQN